MKKLIILLCLTFLFSCSKDDAADSFDIVGTVWEMEFLNIDGSKYYNDFEFVDEETTERRWAGSPIPGTYIIDDDLIQITEDLNDFVSTPNTFKIYSATLNEGNDRFDGTYTVSGETFPFVARIK